MKQLHRFATLLGILLAALMPLGAKAAEGLLINGAGATFPYPIYSKWFYEYQRQHPGIKFNYQSIGSGGGIKQITEKTVDFGASDAPMSNDDLAKASAPLLHIPTVLGAVVVVYNAPDIKGTLTLSGEAVADIFLGKITKWNDAKLAALNPGVALPKADILVAHRSDGSGTTYVFTDYLSKVSEEWKFKVGTGKSVNWPVGLGGKGNEGVTQVVQQTPGSIGYVELNYAIQNKLPYASMQNKAGKAITPSLESVSAAAAAALATLPADYRVSIVNPDGANSYPIAAFTYLLVYQQQTDAVRGKALVDFLKWAMRDGQTMAGTLDYAPLPKELIQKINQTINGITIAN